MVVTLVRRRLRSWHIALRVGTPSQIIAQVTIVVAVIRIGWDQVVDPCRPGRSPELVGGRIGQ